MKSICITGNSDNVVKNVAMAFERFGAAPAISLKNDPDMTLNSWLDQVYDTPHSAKNGKKIGKLWEKVLIDLFLINHKRPLWQWNDRKALLAFDYLYDFDPNIFFIIIFTPLAEHIAVSLNKNPSYDNYDLRAEIDEWCRYTKHLNRFNAEPIARTTVINSQYAEPHKIILDLFGKNVTRESFAAIFDYESPWKDPTFLYLTAKLEKAVLDSDEVAGCDSETSHALQEATAALDFYLRNSSASQSAISDKSGKLSASDDSAAINHDLLDRLEELESENDLILFQLHETQEEFEQYIQRSKLALKHAGTSELRLSKALEKHPEYWEYESLEAYVLPGKNAIRWQIKDTYLKTYHCEDLIIQTSGVAERFILSIFNSEHKTSAFFNFCPSAKKLDFHLNHSKKDVPNPFSLLGPTDWDNLIFLINRLIGWTATDQAAAILPNDVIAATSVELKKFRKTLDNWPLTLRYDNISLKEIVDVDNYRALGIALNNIRLGSESWHTLDFRLSTFGNGQGDAGAHPRLEFPESSRHAIQSWYPESNDERGPRLELRFSKPDAMDTAVWSHLADADKLLIAALLKSLNIQIHELEMASRETSVAWHEWHQIVNFMRHTLAKIHQSAN